MEGQRGTIPKACIEREVSYRMRINGNMTMECSEMVLKLLDKI